tara:strand:- start:17291 stop:17761 length:471 start_codon:yes stop_codon:yes gene_type:complete
MHPEWAAHMQCDKHIPKMVVESAQMMASALIRAGVSEGSMPLTKAGKPYKGGYKKHPCTLWAGDTHSNFNWLATHANQLTLEYTKRYGKKHACAEPIIKMSCLVDFIPEGYLTDFAQAMPDEYKNENPVKAYRAYYKSKTFAKWEKGTPAPDWWEN